MTPALWVAWAATVVFVIAGLAAYPQLVAERAMKSLERKRVLVFTVDGGVFDGLLVAYDRRTWTLIDVHERSRAVPIPASAGEFYLFRERIAYFQRITSDGAPTVVPVAAAPPEPTAMPSAA